VPVTNNGTPTGDQITMHPMAPFPNLDRDVLMSDFNVVYPLYAGNKRKNAVASTKDLSVLYNKNLDETKADLVRKVKTAYYNYITISEVINVYKLALNQLNKHLELAQKAYEEGVRSEFDIMNFKSKIAGFNSKIIELEGKRNVVLTALKNLIVLPAGDSVVFTGSINDFYAASGLKTPAGFDKIKTNNYKVQSLESMINLMEKKKKMEMAANLPVVFAFGNYHIYHGRDFPPFDDAWRNGYAIGIGVKVNLFDGNVTKGKVEEVKAVSEKLQNYKEGIKLKLHFEYEKALENINDLKTKIEAEKKSLEVGKKAYEIAKVGYKNGVITNIELNDAQLNVLKIETSILNIKKELLIQYSELDYLDGSLN
jgi:outer membrane protein TolC